DRNVTGVQTCALPILGIEARAPRFSWELEHEERGQFQTAYHIVVASTLAQLDSGVGDLWDSGKVASSDLPLVEYAGSALVSRQQIGRASCREGVEMCL